MGRPMSQPRVVGARNGFAAQTISVAMPECNTRREFTLPRKHCGPGHRDQGVNRVEDILPSPYVWDMSRWRDFVWILLVLIVAAFIAAELISIWEYGPRI